MRLLGLTGGMGAGKSEALAAFGRLGAATLSSDAVVHELLARRDVRELLVQRLGPEVAPGGRVDRRVVATRVFERPEDRRWLEEVLWPRVEERILEWRGDLDAAAGGPRAAVVEVPLLFESGMDRLFDATVAVVSERSTERAAARGHAGVESRAARQLSQAEKAARADHVVRNDGRLEDLERELSSLLERMAR